MRRDLKRRIFRLLGQHHLSQKRLVARIETQPRRWPIGLYDIQVTVVFSIGLIEPLEGLVDLSTVRMNLRDIIRSCSCKMRFKVRKRAIGFALRPSAK
jgi:hypothetical protein